MSEEKTDVDQMEFWEEVAIKIDEKYTLHAYMESWKGLTLDNMIQRTYKGMETKPILDSWGRHYLVQCMRRWGWEPIKGTQGLWRKKKKGFRPDD